MDGLIYFHELDVIAFEALFGAAMGRNGKGNKVQFGIYEADLETHYLTKSGFRIRLQDQPFQVLALLLERAGEVVTRQEIREKIWAEDTFVAFDEGLNTAIKKVRAALSDSAENPRFVETVPKVGYRFIAPVTAVTPEVGDPKAQVVGPAAEAELPVGAGASEPYVIEDRTDGPRRQTARRTRWISAVWVGTIAACLVAVYWLRPVAANPRLRRIRQYTHLGSLYGNQNLVSDGTRVYFTVDENGGRGLAYVSVDGGEVNRIPIAFPTVDVQDISPSGTEVLVTRPDQPPPRQLWRIPLNGTSPRQVDGVKVTDSFWMPDGRIGYAQETDLFLLTGEGGENKRFAHFEDQIPFTVRWRPDGGLARFMLVGENQSTLWQIKPDGGGLKPVLPDWKTSIRCWPGRWSNDGSYYYFVAADGSVRNVWVLRERADALHRTSSEPAQLTSGPISFFQPVPGRDGKTIFVIGEQRAGQLVRYDGKTGAYSPFLPGLSADHVSFSGDGNWMAYVQYPEGALYRSRVDGSEKLQLTFAPMRTYQPRWSPDGRWISFYATPSPGKLAEIYVVSRDGGELRLLHRRTASEDSHVWWSADSKIEYAITPDEAGAATTIYAQELNTGSVTQNTVRLTFDMGECSPDGRYISGYSDDHELMLYDIAHKQTRRLSGYADYFSWSADSRYLYFNNFFDQRRKEPAGVYRVSIADGKAERLMGTPGFPLTGVFGAWSGTAPDGSVLVLQDKSSRDLYALDLELP